MPVSLNEAIAFLPKELLAALLIRTRIEDSAPVLSFDASHVLSAAAIAKLYGNRFCNSRRRRHMHMLGSQIVGRPGTLGSPRQNFIHKRTSLALRLTEPTVERILPERSPLVARLGSGRHSGLLI